MESKTKIEPFGNSESRNTGIEVNLSPTEECVAIHTHEGVVRV